MERLGIGGPDAAFFLLVFLYFWRPHGSLGAFDVGFNPIFPSDLHFASLRAEAVQTKRRANVSRAFFLGGAQPCRLGGFSDGLVGGVQ
jgi:hypothetical protein